jgi:hypothetical protein
VKKDFNPDGVRCKGEAVETIAMNDKMDPHYGCLIYEILVKPESDGVILSYGDNISGYMFYVQNGIPGFCFSSGNRFHALDGDDVCLGKPTHLMVELDNYTTKARFFVNGKLVQTETIYCNLRRLSKAPDDITLGAEPEPLVDAYDLSKLGGFTGSVYAFKMQRKRMSDEELAAYAKASEAR